MWLEYVVFVVGVGVAGAVGFPALLEFPSSAVT